MTGNSLWRLAVFCLCLLLPQKIIAETVFLDKIDLETLDRVGASREWKKLLFYAPAWGRGELSLVDDPKFFADPAGRSLPEDELIATIKAFTEGMISSRQQALCKYPARRKFLEKALNTKFEDTDPDNESDVCKRHKIFTEQVKAETVSLIFSSYFPGNPASLFGHTFLKFKKTAHQDTSENALLDYGVNHSAYPTTKNPFLYPLYGLTGQFPGMISMMPYYVKVQEYNNAESRDLWEYDLNLTSDEVSSMLLSVFELSTHRIDYFYFDDNCSYLMLALMDAARPSLELVSKFRSWVIPGDTIRVVAGTPELVKQVNFRPSNMRKYLNLESSLSDKERSALKAMMFSQKIENIRIKTPRHVKTKKTIYYKVSLNALKGLDANEQTRVLDTALEYIDANEQLAGSKVPVKWKNERDLLLNRRAELGTISAPNVVAPPQSEAPHLAYPPTRVSLGFVNASVPDKFFNSGLLLGWRPALHSLDNPIAGMGADLGIAFLNTELLLSGKKINLRELTLLSIESMQLPRPNVSSLSWAFELAYQQRCFNGCRQIFANIEVGLTFPTGSPDDRLALRGGAKIGDDKEGALFIEPTVNGVANFPLSLNSRWVSRLAIGGMASLWRGLSFVADGSTTYVYRPVEPWEFQVGAELLNKELQILARTHYYF